MSKLIVVTGITGAQVCFFPARPCHFPESSDLTIYQGGSVEATFSKLPGWRVRGVTRDTSKPTARELAAQGIEVVQADFDDAESLVTAFHGAHSIFAVTDFWAPLQNPATFEKAAVAEKTVYAYAYDLELQHGKNIANAAAKTNGLERFIYSALSDASKWSKGKYTGVYHFESKAKVVEYIWEELPELDAKMSTVQMGNYTTNWKKVASMQPVKVILGLSENPACFLIFPPSYWQRLNQLTSCSKQMAPMWLKECFQATMLCLSSSRRRIQGLS